MTSKKDPTKFIQSIVQNTLRETIRTISMTEGLNPSRLKFDWEKSDKEHPKEEPLQIAINAIKEINTNTSKNNAAINNFLKEIEKFKQEITQITTSINNDKIISVKKLEEDLHQKEMQIQNSKLKEAELKNTITALTTEISTLRSNLSDVKDNDTKLRLNIKSKDDQIDALQNTLQEHIQNSKLKESELKNKIDHLIKETSTLNTSINALKLNESKLKLDSKSKDNQINELEKHRSDQTIIIRQLQSKLDIAIEELTTRQIQLSNKNTDQTTIGYIEHFTSINSAENFNVKKIDLKTVRYEIKKELILIGRGDFCDIIIASPEISLAHSLLIYISEHQIFLLYDLDSRNGTFFGESKVNKPYELNFGDLFTIANSEHFKLQKI